MMYIYFLILYNTLIMVLQPTISIAPKATRGIKEKIMYSYGFIL